MHSSTWKEVKQKVDRLSEPNREVLVNVLEIDEGTHSLGQNKHNLKKYSYLIEKVTLAYEIWFKYALCPDCQELRWKKFIALNWRDGLAYERVLVKRGKTNDIDENNVLEAMK